MPSRRGSWTLCSEHTLGKVWSSWRAKWELKCQDLNGLSSPLASLPVVSAALDQPKTNEGPWFHMLHEALGSLWWPLDPPGLAQLRLRRNATCSQSLIIVSIFSHSSTE